MEITRIKQLEWKHRKFSHNLSRGHFVQEVKYEYVLAGHILDISDCTWDYLL
jgi:hypothetical protein